MARFRYLTVLPPMFACVLATAGAARADDAADFKSLMEDCSRSDLAISDINDCLERARVLSETSPSPQLITLTARLERIAESELDGAAPARQGTSTPAASPPAAPHDTAFLVKIRAEEHEQQAPVEITVDDAYPPTEVEAPDDTGPPAEKSGQKSLSTPQQSHP